MRYISDSAKIGSNVEFGYFVTPLKYFILSLPLPAKLSFDVTTQGAIKAQSSISEIAVIYAFVSILQ